MITHKIIAITAFFSFIISCSDGGGDDAPSKPKATEAEELVATPTSTEGSSNKTSTPDTTSTPDATTTFMSTVTVSVDNLYSGNITFSLNGIENITLSGNSSGTSSSTFSTEIASGETYNVSVVSQPSYALHKAPLS